MSLLPFIVDKPTKNYYPRGAKSPSEPRALDTKLLVQLHLVKRKRDMQDVGKDA